MRRITGIDSRRCIGVAALLVGSVVVAACGDEEEEAVDPSEDDCVYRRNLLAVRTPPTATPPNTLEIDGVVLRRFGSEGGAAPRGFPIGADVEQLSAQNLSLFTIDPEADDGAAADADALQLAVSFNEDNEELEASPVLLVEPNGHWILAPGTTAGEVEGVQLDFPDSEPSADTPIVAVVDTGHDDNDWPWNPLRVRRASESGLDTDQAVGTRYGGHGTFIASLILQAAPESAVVVAGMPNILLQGSTTDFDEYFQFPPSGHSQLAIESAIAEATELDALTYVTDELYLFGAVERLLASREDPTNASSAEVFPRYDVLNLSGGTYRCGSLDGAGLLTRSAIDHWYEVTDGKPVVAAAGNHGDDPEPHATDDPPDGYPRYIPGQEGVGSAADGGALFGIQSVDVDGNLSSFSNEGLFSEIGEHLCGIRSDPNQVIEWGGTSFAAPVAAARLLTADPDNLDDALIEASDPSEVDADDLPGTLQLCPSATG